MRLVNISEIEKVYTDLKRDLRMLDDSRHADSMIGGMRSLMAKIYEIPVAYDVDKVVDELDSAAYSECICDIDGWEIDEDLLKADMVEDIIRRGGVDEG